LLITCSWRHTWQQRTAHSHLA